MPYKTPRIPIWEDLKGVERRIQDLQLNIAELDWLEYPFGLAKVLDIGNDEEDIAPIVYTGVRRDSLDMRPWPNDNFKAYAFWMLTEADEFEYNDNINGLRRFPKIKQPVTLIVCLNNEKISTQQDYNITHMLCREELLINLSTKNMSSGIFQVVSVLQNVPEVFDGFEVRALQEPYSCMRIDGVITYKADCDYTLPAGASYEGGLLTKSSVFITTKSGDLIRTKQ